MFDISGHSRGTPTISEALNKNNALATFPFSKHARFDTSIHINYIDAIDFAHDFPDVEWPWAHGGALIRDGFVSRRGNETISSYAAEAIDEVFPPLHPLEWPALIVGDYVTAGGNFSGGKFDHYLAGTHTFGLPVGWDREEKLSFAHIHQTPCGSTGNEVACERFGEFEQYIQLNFTHTPIYILTPQLYPGDPNFDPLEIPMLMAPSHFEDCDARTVVSPLCTHPVDCDPIDVTGPCAPPTSCTAPNDLGDQNFCYRASSQLGPYIAAPRSTAPSVTDDHIVGWAPGGGLDEEESFLRTATDEGDRYLPTECGGTYNGSLIGPADDIGVAAGMATVSEEMVEDWDFRITGNLVLAAGDIDEELREDYFEEEPLFEEIADFILHIQDYDWVESVWNQDPCVYDELDPCAGVTGGADTGHTAAEFQSRYSDAFLESIDMAAIVALSDPLDRTTAFFAAVEADRQGLSAAELDDRNAYLHHLSSGASAVTETYAAFPAEDVAGIESRVNIRSRHHVELLLRVDVEFVETDGYIDIVVEGENLNEVRRVSATGLGRDHQTFALERTAPAVTPYALNDLIRLEGRGVHVYSVSIRPHRIHAMSTGRIYEYVLLREGVSWDHARAIALRTKYFGMSGRLAQPVDGTILAKMDTLEVHYPAWVGASMVDSAGFMLDDESTVPTGLFPQGVPSDTDYPLYAYLKPDTTEELYHRRNGVQLDGERMAFVIEYDPPDFENECLNDAALEAHWRLTDADRHAPIADEGNYTLPYKEGDSVGVDDALDGTSGHSLVFDGATAFYGASSERLEDFFLFYTAALSGFFRPDTVTGDHVILHIGDTKGYETPQRNVVVSLGQAEDELSLTWEYDSGTDVSLVTDGLNMIVDETYHIVVALYESPAGSAYVDAAIFVSTPGAGRVFEQVWFDQQRPTDASPSEVFLGGKYTTQLLDGALDSIRIWGTSLTSAEAWTLFEGEMKGEDCGYWP